MGASVRQGTRAGCTPRQMGELVRGFRAALSIPSVATRMNPFCRGRPLKCWWYLAIAMALLALPTAAIAADGWTPLKDGWVRYVNERFGTIVELPLHLFKPATPPENGDGRTLDAGDGAQILVSASYAPYTVTEDFRGYKTWLLRENGIESITYKAEGAAWLAFSGVQASAVVYVKGTRRLRCRARDPHQISVGQEVRLRRHREPRITLAELS